MSAVGTETPVFCPTHVLNKNNPSFNELKSLFVLSVPISVLTLLEFCEHKSEKIN